MYVTTSLDSEISIPWSLKGQDTCFQKSINTKFGRDE